MAALLLDRWETAQNPCSSRRFGDFSQPIRVRHQLAGPSVWLRERADLVDMSRR